MQNVAPTIVQQKGVERAAVNGAGLASSTSYSPGIGHKQ